jgi:D-amino-acid dehydrogenase
MTPDGLPVIGRLGQNVTIASGHAMLGVTLAPVTGELVAELIATGTEPQVLEPFTPTRFS